MAKKSVTWQIDPVILAQLDKEYNRLKKKGLTISKQSYVESILDKHLNQ